MDRLHRLAPYAILVFFGICIYAPLLFFGRAFYGEEQAGFYYVISSYVDQSLRTGLPLTWIPNYFGGVPASLDQFVSAWYPLNRMLFSLFDIFTAHHLSITIATIAGLILSYLFGRMHGWRRTSSIALGLFYFSATTFAWIQIGTLAAHSFAMLPGVLLALQYAYTRSHYLYAILGGALALGIGFLAGFMQIIFYNYVIGGLYALFLDWTRFSRERPLYANFPISLTYAGITLLGLCIGFLQFYPSASMIDLTIRTDTYAIQNAVTVYPSELLAYILPPYLSVPFWGGGGAAGMQVTVLGLIACFFALYRYRSPFTLFFAGTYALFVGFACGLPPFNWINQHVPPFSHMGGNFRWAVGAAFLIAFIAAAGIEGYLRNPGAISPRVRRRILWAIGLIATALVVGSLALEAVSVAIARSPETVNSLITWYTQGRTLVHPLSHYETVLQVALNDVSATFSLANPRFLFGVVLWPLAGAVLALAFKRKTMPYAPYLFIGYIVVAVLGTVALQWGDLVPRSLYTEKPRLVEILEASEGGRKDEYRIMGYLIGEGVYLQLLHEHRPSPIDNTRLQLQTLVNNANLYYGIDRMDGMEPYRTLRHNHLLNTVIAYDWAAWAFDDTSPALITSKLDQLYNRDVQKNVPLEDKLADFPKRLPLLSMMNVKYVFSPYRLGGELRLIEAISIPVGISSDVTVYLYENPHVLPRVYAARRVTYARSDREALLTTISEDDFSTNAVLECAYCADTSSGEANVTVTRYERGSIEVNVDAKADTWIVFAESNFPGWYATIDGVEAEIVTANYLFQAVRVPAGEHIVSLEYKDVAFDILQSAF